LDCRETTVAWRGKSIFECWTSLNFPAAGVGPPAKESAEPDLFAMTNDSNAGVPDPAILPPVNVFG